MRALAVLVLVTSSTIALGHGGEPQAGKFPYFDGTGITGGGSSWGIVLLEGGHFARVCEEAYSNAEFAELPTPPRQLNSSFSYLRSDGGVLIGGFGGTYVSHDAGCTYEAVPFFAGQVTSALARANGTLLVATSTLQGGNGLYASVDEGDTWSTLLPLVENVLFFQLVASADGSRIMASGNSTGPTAPAVFVSTDGGASFADVSAAYASFPLVRAAAFDDGGDALFGGFDAQGKGLVLRAAAPYHAPVSQPVEIVDAKAADVFPGEISHVAVVPNGGGLVALARLGKLLFHQPLGGVFVQVTAADTGPTDCVFLHPDGDRLIGCGQELATGSLGLFMESNDGIAWRETIAFDDVRYRRCPADTVGAIACASQFESSCSNNLDDDFDQLLDCADDDCADACAPVGGEGEGEGEGEGDGVLPPVSPGCASSTSNGALLALGALLLLVRRTRRAL